jgi:hypothetical protein
MKGNSSYSNNSRAIALAVSVPKTSARQQGEQQEESDQGLTVKSNQQS